MKADVRTMDARKSGTIDLSDAVFGLDPRADLLHRMVRYQLAKRRAGTQSVKGRSDIRGTGAKMYKQKGTGRARHGNAKAPQLRGGGKAFAPKPRSHAIGLPKKVRKLALCHALSAKAKADELMVLDKAEVKEAKTGNLKKKLDKLGLASALIVSGPEPQPNFNMAARNLPNIDVLPVQGINVYDILRRDVLVLTVSALESLEARFK
jgi:large subunit ribosomal protein L4